MVLLNSGEFNCSTAKDMGLFSYGSTYTTHLILDDWLGKCNSDQLRFQIMTTGLFLTLFITIQLPDPPNIISVHWYAIEHPVSLLQSTKLIVVRAEVIMQAAEALQHLRLTLKPWQQNYIFWWSFSHAYSWPFPVWYTSGTHKPINRPKPLMKLDGK